MAKLAQAYRNKKGRRDDDDLSAEEAAYKGLIAGSSSEESSEELSVNGDGETNQKRNQAKIDEMRQKLLGSLTDDRNDRGKKGKSLHTNGGHQMSDDEVSDGEREELEVNFGVGFGEDIGKNLLAKKQERKEKERMSDFQKWQEKRKERKRQKKQDAKEKVKLAKKQGKMSEKDVEAMTEEERKKRAELDLLLDDGEEKVKLKSSKLGKRDMRFVRDEDNDFAVDPTHKEYRKVTQGHNKISKRKKF